MSFQLKANVIVWIFFKSAVVRVIGIGFHTCNRSNCQHNELRFLITVIIIDSVKKWERWTVNDVTRSADFTNLKKLKRKTVLVDIRHLHCHKCLQLFFSAAQVWRKITVKKMYRIIKTHFTPLRLLLQANMANPRQGGKIYQLFTTPTKTVICVKINTSLTGVHFLHPHK